MLFVHLMPYILEATLSIFSIVILGQFLYMKNSVADNLFYSMNHDKAYVAKIGLQK